jgi:hypothetical protein
MSTSVVPISPTGPSAPASRRRAGLLHEQSPSCAFGALLVHRPAQEAGAEDRQDHARTGDSQNVA